MGISPVPHHPPPHPRYRKAFDVEPSLHSGINAAVLLIADGQRFEDSEELRLIGEPQSCTPSPTHRRSEELAERAGREDTGLELGLTHPILDLFCLNPHLGPYVYPGPS